MAPGEGPIQDVALVKDYAAGMRTPPSIFFRIHMDVRITESDYQALGPLLDRGALDEVYNHLANKFMAYPKWGHALATIREALRQDRH
jgi:hypothetical protein